MGLICGLAKYSTVIAGLVPAIPIDGQHRAMGTEMAGPSPAMPAMART